MQTNRETLISEAGQIAEESIKRDLGITGDVYPDGFCHLVWNLQKSILKNKYNIDWLTPVEEHPEIHFD